MTVMARTGAGQRSGGGIVKSVPLRGVHHMRHGATTRSMLTMPKNCTKDPDRPVPMGGSWQQFCTVVIGVSLVKLNGLYWVNW